MTRSHFIFGPVGPVNPRTGKVMSPTYNKADAVNHEGLPAFTRSIEETTLALLMTNTLSNTFYVSQEGIVKETLEVLRAMSDKDPEFLAKALVHARTKGLLKLVSTVGLAVLSENKTKAGQEAFRKVFRHVIKIPDDLREFASMVRTGGFGKKAFMGLRKTMVQNWLRHMSEYHAVKYGSTASEGITLRDILRLTHPRPKANGDADKKGRDYDRLRNGAQAELFGWLVNGWKEVGPEPSPTNPQVWALEKVKRSEDDQEIISLVRKHRLPQEAVIPSVKKMTKPIWLALLEDMPYMALLRNLNTMGRHGVLEDKTIVKEIAQRISDKENVASSKQFPFRFLSAFKVFNGPQEIRDALVDALEHSFINMPEIKGLRVVVSNDVSTSMDMKVVGRKKPQPGRPDNSPQCREIAALFAAALFKRCDDSVILPFNTVAQPELGRVSKRDSMMTIAQKIGVLSGGTNLGAPCEYMMDKPEKVDVFILLTDDEDWAGSGFLTAFEAYKKRKNPAAKAFCVRLAPKKTFSAPPGYPDVHFAEGWSAEILSYIPLALNSGGSQVDEVRKMDLASINEKKREAVEETATSATEE